MGDQFEKFIIENKEAFNDGEPSDQVWNDVEKKLGKRKSYLSMVWKVAAMLFMASTLYLAFDRNNQTVAGPELSDEFEQAEDYYINLISLKKQELTKKLSSQDQEKFLADIDQLDSMYLELKETYQTNASNDRVVDAMVSNLQLRLNILTKQLEILEKIKNENKEINENTTPSLST
ncbi:MAG: hypothetical protein AB8B73_11275 [Ekhidna sp.]